MAHKELFQGLELNKSILRQFLSVMSETEIQRRIKDYWTIFEHLTHLTETQEMTVMRIGKFSAEEAPAIVPFTPDKRPEVQGKPTTTQLIDTFCRLRDEQLRLIRKAKAADWAKVGSHGEYRKYSLEILVRHTLLHDHFHMARMEQLWVMKEEFILPLDSN